MSGARCSAKRSHFMQAEVGRRRDISIATPRIAPANSSLLRGDNRPTFARQDRFRLFPSFRWPWLSTLERRAWRCLLTIQLAKSLPSERLSPKNGPLVKSSGVPSCDFAQRSRSTALRSDPSLSRHDVGEFASSARRQCGRSSVCPASGNDQLAFQLPVSEYLPVPKSRRNQ